MKAPSSLVLIRQIYLLRAVSLPKPKLLKFTQVWQKVEFIYVTHYLISFLKRIIY